MLRKNKLREDEIIEILDILVALPRRDTLRTIITSEEPLTAIEIARFLNISVSEVLDYLQVLERTGLVVKTIQLPTKKTAWRLAHTLSLQVNISQKSIKFLEIRPTVGYLRRILSTLHLNWFNKT